MKLFDLSQFEGCRAGIFTPPGEVAALLAEDRALRKQVETLEAANETYHIAAQADKQENERLRAALERILQLAPLGATNDIEDLAFKALQGEEPPCQKKS